MFEMAGDGMREVKNASEMLLSERAADASGSVVMCAMEGTRPMLTDVQALVTTTVFGNPRRMASGVDQGRLALLLAVLEKRAGFRLYDQDVYINIAGGMTLTEPAADLALVLAVASSRWNVSPGTDFAAMGEVGLAGEVRAIAHAQRRVDECVRLGFRRIVLPRANLRQIQAPEGAQIVGVSTVLEATALLKRTNRPMPRKGNDGICQTKLCVNWTRATVRAFEEREISGAGQKRRFCAPPPWRPRRAISNCIRFWTSRIPPCARAWPKLATTSLLSPARRWRSFSAPIARNGTTRLPTRTARRASRARAICCSPWTTR